MTDTLTLIRPDDWHVHLRDGDMLRTVLPFTARQFGRAIIMPNLRPPVTTAARAAAYRDQIMAALPSDSRFTPLMTLYLTDTSDPNDVERAFVEKIAAAVKLYPAHATTNSDHGVSDMRQVRPVLERMQRIGMPLLLHGEVTDPSVDIFDREAVFIDRVLIGLRHDFPDLKIVLEHITTDEAANYVAQGGAGKGQGKLAATITAHHLLVNRNAMLAGGIRPHLYCLPIVKREKHRQALVKAAISGGPMFFLGTDTAPHPDAGKLAACGCAGIFTAPQAIELYAQVFHDAGRLDRLEAFASRNGPVFYGLPVNSDTITLRNSHGLPTDVKPILTPDGQTITPFAPPEPLAWRLD